VEFGDNHGKREKAFSVDIGAKCIVPGRPSSPRPWSIMPSGSSSMATGLTVYAGTLLAFGAVKRSEFDFIHGSIKK
jgi:hypothetical protein